MQVSIIIPAIVAIDVIVTNEFVVDVIHRIGSWIFWRLEKFFISGDKSPPTFAARFHRKFCDLQASIYGKL